MSWTLWVADHRPQDCRNIPTFVLLGMSRPALCTFLLAWSGCLVLRHGLDCVPPLFVCVVLGRGVLVVHRVAVGRTPGAWVGPPFARIVLLRGVGGEREFLSHPPFPA